MTSPASLTAIVCCVTSGLPVACSKVKRRGSTEAAEKGVHAEPNVRLSETKSVIMVEYRKE